VSSINFNQLSMREIATIEELSGLPIGALSDDEAPKGRALAALAFVVKHREDASFTWNDAQDLTMSDVTALIGSDDADEEAPLPSDDSPKGKPSK
jgi:hypothetical protein